LRSQLHFLHVLKDAKPQAIPELLPSASDDLIKAIVECAINTFNGNHKLTKEEKSKSSKYEDNLRMLVNAKISFKSKRNLLIQEGGFIVPLLTCILTSVIGEKINYNNLIKALQRMILVPRELREKRSHSTPPVKKYSTVKIIDTINGRKFVCIKTHT
jgi:hypothetical protein